MHAAKSRGIRGNKKDRNNKKGKYGGGVHSDTTIPIFKKDQRKLMHKSKGGYNSVHKRVC